MHTEITSDEASKLENMLYSKDKDLVFLARQYMLSKVPLSKAVELYLHDNEGRVQNLDKFPMMRQIYDNMPQRLLLKCSRKTLKSTLLSNILTLNMIRYNYYKMLYVAPQEASAKYFSNNYLNPRFESPSIKSIIPGWVKNDVMEKQLKGSNSAVILRYAKDDATRTRGPATSQNLLDEVQDIEWDVLPIIHETMALSEVKREIYAGTPLTRANTLNKLWMQSNQLEWAMKCTGCNHWNTLTEDNNPMDMIQPHGLSCSKCKKIINSELGLWVSTGTSQTGLIGYHLAQPILPHFNQNPKEWLEIYEKVYLKEYSPLQIYNEVFGLAYDLGTTGITEEELKQLCVLGKQADDKGNYLIHSAHKYNYCFTALAADWGVNMDTSRTACCAGGLREDGIIEIFLGKIYKSLDYDAQIKDIADKANKFNAFVASDAGPDPNRGIQLANLTSPQRAQLVRYEAPKVMQYYSIPSNSVDWSQNRWCLHRTDTLSLIYRLLKQKRIVFPNWEDMQECMADILNVKQDIRTGALRDELFYYRAPGTADDFMHALNWVVCQLLVRAGDPLLHAPSSSASGAQD